jgi:hypothetical protein
MTTTVARPRPRERPSDGVPTLGRAAAGLALLVALAYLLIFVGVLSVGEATDGELGILGFAAGVFAVIAGLLWRVGSRVLWATVAVLQVLVIAAYVAISSDREPPFEVWGVSIRIVQVALLATLVVLLLRARHASQAPG